MSQEGNNWWAMKEDNDKDATFSTTPKSKGVVTLEERSCPPPPQKSQPPPRYNESIVRANLSTAFEQEHVREKLENMNLSYWGK